MLTLLKCLWYNQRLIIYPHGFSFLMDEAERDVSIPCVPYENVELVTADNVKLRCYLIPTTKEPIRGTVIIFHGNAMNHGEIVMPHAMFFSRSGFAVLTLEYRGYGLSDGTPSESGLCLDAQAGIDFLFNHPELSKYPLIVFGQSLGGAVAIDVTSRNANRVSALIIENTFRSIPQLVRDWQLGRLLSFFVTQKWLSASKLAQMPTSLPILMLSGLRDSVVPSTEMEELWEVAKKRRAKPKSQAWFALPTFIGKTDKIEEAWIPPRRDVFKSFKRGDHNDTFMQRGYWETVISFLDEVIPATSL